MNNISLMTGQENELRLKVSKLTRLIIASICIVPLVGVILSSTMLVQMFVALSKKVGSGKAEVLEIMSSASLPLTVSIYLAIVVGFVLIACFAVRYLPKKETSNPPVWFFIVCGVLYLIPVGLNWRAQSLIIEVISPNNSIPSNEIEGTGAYVAGLLVASVFASVLASVVLVVVSVIPFSSRSVDMRDSLISVVAIEILLFLTLIAIPV